jgi:RNA polymerase sigma factor (sigma-70 family)
MTKVPLVRLVHRLRQIATVPNAREVTDGQLLREFDSGKDQAAFAALVERYGALVLGVCRKVLRHEQDAEDAFQATFVVLARRAGSLRRHGNLAGWLYGVAYRVAIQSRRNAARRRMHEARFLPPAVDEPRQILAWQEVQAILTEEIQRLPEQYRTPFVLCQVQGQGRAEVARLLAIKEGTVWSRLAYARKRLQARLARRGIELGAVLAASYVAAGPGHAMALPASVRNAALAGATDARLSPEVDALVWHAVRFTAITKVRAGLALLIACIPGIVTGALALQAPPPVAVPVEGPAVARASVDGPPATEDGQRGHTDRYGDPLPEEALARLGTVRFRVGSSVHVTQFLPDGKGLILAGTGAGVSPGRIGPVGR